jgi:hypothetical protein
MYRQASESLIVYLAKKSIAKFKELFPNEEPFIKIICLRDKRLSEEYKSGKRSWRKLEITGKNESDVVELKGPVTEKIQKIKTKTRKFFQHGSNITDKISRGKNTKLRATNVKTKEIVNVNEPDVTFTESVIERDVFVDDLSVMLQAEVHTQDCEHRYDYIQVGRQCLTVDVIDTNLPIGQSVVVKSSDNLSELLSLARVALQSFEDNVKNLDNRTKECNLLRENLQILESKLSSRSESDEKKMERIHKVLNTTETSVEIAEKYVKLQEKLNILKKSTRKYTVPEELEWPKLIKEKGFILALVDLVHFWWDLSNDEPPDSCED